MASTLLSSQAGRLRDDHHHRSPQSRQEAYRRREIQLSNGSRAMEASAYSEWVGGGMSNFVMYADDLLSKWGFGGGDRLADYCHDEFDVYDFQFNCHKALEELVKRYLLPKLDKKVEIMFIGTIHNPVRAEMIDGQYYTNHYEHDDDGLLGYVTVEVTPYQVLEVMKLNGYKIEDKP